MDIELFRFIRVSRRMTQRDFAKAIGVSHGLVAQIEANMKRLSPRTATRVREAFELKDEDLSQLRKVLKSVV